MTILAGDIKLVESQVMLDTTEGGGAPTSNVIEDATSNSIFPDISETDRAGGRVNLRKVHATVQTLTTDGYYGANMIVAEPPADPNVSVTLFTTNSVFDRRSDAQSRLESYLAYGPPFQGYLFGNHLTGQMTVSFFAPLDTEIPVVGSTFVLVKNEGLTTELSQFLRVTSASSVEHDFEDGQGIFRRQIITVGVSDTLRYDFVGFDATRYPPGQTELTNKTRVRTTVVANAARYYGVSPLASAAAVGDYSIEAESIFTQLVPSAQIETPIVDARMNQQSAALAAAGSNVTITPTQVFDPTHNMYVGGGILPGSLSVVRDGITITDAGGLLLRSSDATQVGTIDYGNGVLTLTTAVFGASGGSHNVTFTPAYTPTIVSKSFGLPVTAVSQRLTWVITLEAAPAKRSLQVSYRSQGRWYSLSEDGSGAIRGTDAAFGVGSLNYLTGTVSMTLGALPDVGSKIIYTWAPSVTSPKLSAMPVSYDEAVLSNRLYAKIEVGAPIKPGSLTMSWSNSGTKNAADNNGDLTGDAVGRVVYGTGTILFSPNSLPAVGTDITINIVPTTAASQSITSYYVVGSTYNFDLTSLPIKPKTIVMSAWARIESTLWSPGGMPPAPLTPIRIIDDGSGVLIVADATGYKTIGTVNYSTGAVSINNTVSAYNSNAASYGTTQYIPDYNLYSGSSAPFTGSSYGFTGFVADSMEAQVQPPVSSNPIQVNYGTTDGTGATYHVGLTELRLNGSYSRFHVGSAVYVTNSESTDVIRDPSSTTGSGTVAGTVLARSLATFSQTTRNGSISLNSWPTAVSPVLTYAAGVASPAISGSDSVLSVDCAMFRTAVAPIRNGSFQIAGNWLSGDPFTATSDSSGVIKTGSTAGADSAGSLGVFGIVDYDAGVIDVRFGRRVPDTWATNPNVLDLSYLGITGVKYVQSEQVQADTLRYNASAYTYLPLNATLLGIDPVRLPSDGRVPIFKAGDFAVVGHTGTTTPATVSNGQTINCGRVRLSRVRVIGNNGLIINNGYTTNLDAGTVTFTDVSGYSQPVTIEHRIEDMALVRDAQISGLISFTRPLTHVFPLGSYVSSALVAGDLNVHTPVFFDQATWNNAWSDILSGSAATGSYNDVLAPIELTNKGTVTERWAIVFTNTTSFNVIGEHVGVIATGNTSSDLAPINPATGAAYFTLRATGWGSGWTIGNVLRFNTVGAAFPVWLVRTIQAGPETVVDDRFTVLVRGDVDHP